MKDEAKRANPLEFKEQLIWYSLTILEMLFVLRFFLKLMGAERSSFFVKFVYGLTGIFHWPLASVTPTFSFAGGIVIEPTTILAMIVYWMVAMGLVKLLELLRVAPELKIAKRKDSRSGSGAPLGQFRINKA